MENSPAFHCFWFNRNSNLGIDNHNSPYASERLYINQIELDNSVSARLLKEGKFVHPLEVLLHQK